MCDAHELMQRVVAKREKLVMIVERNVEELQDDGDLGYLAVEWATELDAAALVLKFLVDDMSEPDFLKEDPIKWADDNGLTGGNAGCDKCGMNDRIDGSTCCKHCSAEEES